VPGLSGVAGVAAGSSHSLALMANGTLLSWGYNYFGQLGANTGSTQSYTPAQLENPNVRLQSSAMADRYFSTISAALTVLPTTAPALLVTLQKIFSEALNINLCGATLTIGSAYDPTFATRVGTSTVQGTVSVTCGTLIVDDLLIN